MVKCKILIKLFVLNCMSICRVYGDTLQMEVVVCCTVYTTVSLLSCICCCWSCFS